MSETRPITREEILSRRTVHGGWTREALAELGVPWPPPHGWFDQLIFYGVPYQKISPDQTDPLASPKTA